RGGEPDRPSRVPDARLGPAGDARGDGTHRQSGAAVGGDRGGGGFDRRSGAGVTMRCLPNTMPAAFTPLLLIGTLVSSAVQAQAPSPAAPPPPERLAALIDSAASDAVARHLTPAVSIGVSRGGRTIYAKGFGWADLENQVQATAETVYQIGSITKQFTAAAILQLVEQGKLSLDDRLTRFFPDWPAPGNQVTIRQLLNH